MECVLRLKTLWSVVALAAAFFVGLGSAAEGDYFSIFADVGYWSDGRIFGKNFVRMDEVRLKVKAGEDCILKATVRGDRTIWECDFKPRGTCGKPGIAIKKTAFPLKAKLDYFRVFRPKDAAEAVICPDSGIIMEKDLMQPVYFTSLSEISDNTGENVLRLVTRRPILGMIQNDVKDEVRPWVTLPFDVLRRNCMGCLVSGAVANGEKRKFSFRVPITPSADLPEVWQFDLNYKVLKRVDDLREEDSVRRGANLFKKNGGLCVLAMPKAKCPCSAIYRSSSSKKKTAGVCFRVKRFGSASSMPYNCVAAIAPPKKGKLTGNIAIRPVFSKARGGGLRLARRANPIASRQAEEAEDDPTVAILDTIAT